MIVDNPIPRRLPTYRIDESSGKLIENGTMRPDGTFRKDRIVRPTNAVNEKMARQSVYVPPPLRKKHYGNNQKGTESLKITIVNDICRKKNKLLDYLNDQSNICTCARVEKLIICTFCGFFAKGRLALRCEVHPRKINNSDWNSCRQCSSEKECLKELDYPRGLKITPEDLAYDNLEVNVSMIALDYDIIAEEQCICERMVDVVICSFCGFFDTHVKRKIKCQFHPGLVRPNEITKCPDCFGSDNLLDLVQLA